MIGIAGNVELCGQRKEAGSPKLHVYMSRAILPAVEVASRSDGADPVDTFVIGTNAAAKGSARVHQPDSRGLRCCRGWAGTAGPVLW